uniref:Myb-like domain-containing protein n=1 Tax=Chlamydomonas euryale TaxID=1486919 RepID=A0A7R9V607_9CHLO|mmetsp:Transcript_21865/g.65422  ORF Transcript_21865/g.65422 Transcript_21865/m.65422 type:complete len:324 (+) Transcript_21865:1261-2232(+)
MCPSCVLANIRRLGMGPVFCGQQVSKPARPCCRHAMRTDEYKFPMTTPIAVLRRELCRDFLNVFWPEMIVLQEEDTAVRLEDTLGGKPATLADFDLSPDHYILMEIILFRRNKELEYVASGKYEEARAEEAGRSAKRGWPAGAWPGMAQAEADEAPPPKRGRPTAASPAAPVRSDGAGPSRGNGRPARLLHGTRVMPGAVVDPANDRILPEPAPGGTAHLGHGRKKNFWTLEETDALLDGMYVHARSWKKIFTEYSEYMPGRRYQDYKDRWENLEKAYLNGFSDERRPLSQRIKRKIKSLITGGGDWPQPEECFEDEIEEDSD